MNSGTPWRLSRKVSTKPSPLLPRSFADAGWPPTSGTQMDIEVRAPAVTHTITLNRISAWVNGVAESPKDKVLKDQLKELLSTLP